MSDLVQRCAAFGWTLRPQGNGWELLGNGAPAEFRSTATLVDWLEHQKRTKKPAAAEQLEMDLAA
jgi:hypothetical protein